MQHLNVNIRLATASSTEQIFKIFTDCKQSMELQDVFQWTANYPNYGNIRDDIQYKHLYEIREGDEIVGVVSVNEHQEPEYTEIDWGDTHGKPLMVHRLAIDPAFQKRGYAAELMGFAEKYAAHSGYTSIRLDAYSGNEKALRFYDWSGYERKGYVIFPGRSLRFVCFEKVFGKS